VRDSMEHCQGWVRHPVRVLDVRVPLLECGCLVCRAQPIERVKRPAHLPRYLRSKHARPNSSGRDVTSMRRCADGVTLPRGGTTWMFGMSMNSNESIAPLYALGSSYPPCFVALFTSALT
jgi:hypothetical protein